jgi:hypothetical protein
MEKTDPVFHLRCSELVIPFNYVSVKGTPSIHPEVEKGRDPLGLESLYYA